jgi:cobalamin-dependent methionine synthase I
MAEFMIKGERDAPRPCDMETASTENLTVIRENLWNGLAVIGQRFIDGTAHEREGVKGAATPAEFGAVLVLPLFFKVNTILVNRGEEDFTGRL